ncbi:MAG: response regulator [Kofleriaceae bacterium]|nr:response regulator [Kofleriaceae bacterium]
MEDDIDLRQALEEALVENGHEVVTASDGALGLEKMRRFHPDVVVLDLMMPKLDGWQFRVAQRQEPAIADTPVVVISASDTPAALAVNADLYVRKPFDADTLVHAIDGVVNAHERKANFARVAQTERLAALGTLAAGLAHEINNPLTYVLIELAHAMKLLDTIATDENRGVIDQVKSLTRTALDGAERISGVTRAIRSFSRPDDRGLVPIDVRGPLEAAIRLVAHDVKLRAKLTTHFETFPMVIANEGGLGQVFLNLLTNAVQAIPEGNPEDNEIRVVAGVDSAGGLSIEIADSGEGIPVHLQQRIFEPFFSTKPVGHGTGLGLSISHSIIRSFGGSLTVTSDPGRGSTFRIRLPPISSQPS